MSNSITVDFKWVFKIHVSITMDLSFKYKSPETLGWIHPPKAKYFTNPNLSTVNENKE